MNDMEPMNERIMNLLDELWYEEQIEEIEALASKYQVTCDYIIEEFILD